MSLETFGLNWDKVDAIITVVQYGALILPICGLITGTCVLVADLLAERRRPRLESVSTSNKARAVEFPMNWPPMLGVHPSD